MKLPGRLAVSALTMFLVLDLLIFPNCTPVNTPDHGPAVLGIGDWRHRLALHIHFGDSGPSESRSLGPVAADWAYSVGRGLGGGQEVGGRLLLGNLLFLPNGIEAVYSRRLGDPGGRSAALNLAIGWHAVDWAHAFSKANPDLEVPLGVWSLMPSLALGSDRFYGGPAFAAAVDWPDVMLLGGGWIGGDFGPGPRFEGMGLGSAKGPRLTFTTSGRLGR